MATIDINLPDICCDLDDNTHVVYVSKIGDDANDGLSIDKPKLTVYDGTANDAAWAALALQSAGATYVKIHILDAGTYHFSWPGYSNIVVYGPAAEMVGQYVLSDGGDVRMRQITAPDGLPSGAAVLFARGSATTTARAYFDVIETRGVNLDQTGVTAVLNDNPNFILFLQAPLVNVCEDGKGLVADNSGVGHIHAQITDLYLRGDNAQGIAPVPSGNGKVYGIVDHIVQTTGATGTSGIVADSGLVLLTANEINTATAFDVSGTADVRITANRIVGTRTGTPTLLITEDTFNGKSTGPDMTTVGGSMATLATPAGPRWPRVNADGTVTLRTGDETAFEVAGTRFYRADGQTGITTSWVNIDGLSMPVVAGQYYEVEVRVLAEINNTGGGINLALDGPAFTYYAARFEGAQSSGTLVRARIIAYDDMDPAGDNTSTLAANQTYLYFLRAGIVPSANGTINARIKRGGAAGTITVRNGIMRVYQ